MKFSYFRQSNNSFDETLDGLKKTAQEKGFQILGEVNIGPKGKLVILCQPSWLKEIAEKNPDLLAFLPCSVAVLEKEGKVFIGSSQPALLKTITQQIPAFSHLSQEIEKTLKELIHQVANVEELKVSKILLYSATTCPYCRMEKEWLDSKGIKYELIYVDLNPEKGKEMVQKTGQYGVPVTEITYENGESEYIIGFDKEKLSGILKVNVN